MKSVKRQQKKRSRARTFDELEKEFYGLVKVHNQLVKSHRALQRKHNSLARTVKDIDKNTPREYGLC